MQSRPSSKAWTVESVRESSLKVCSQQSDLGASHAGNLVLSFLVPETELLPGDHGVGVGMEAARSRGCRMVPAPHGFSRVSWICPAGQGNPANLPLLERWAVRKDRIFWNRKLSADT